MSKKVYIAYTGGTIGMQQVNGRYQRDLTAKLFGNGRCHRQSHFS